MVDFSGGDWIVKALKLLGRSKTLRRMYYSGLAVVLIYALIRSPVWVEVVKLCLD